MIAVLPADVADDLLAEIRQDLEARGWSSELSRGSEQVVLALSGGHDPESLLSVFAGRVDADLKPVLTGREYRLLQFRRRFASMLVTALGVLFAGGLCLPIYFFMRPPKLQLVVPDQIYAASADSLPLDGDKQLTFHDQRVLVVRRLDGSVFATGGRCTHLDGCILEWNQERHQVVCPCCGGAYDAYGNVIEGPPSMPLRTYEVERITNASEDAFYVRQGE